MIAEAIICIYILFSNMNLPRNLSNASRLILFYSEGYFCNKYKVFELRLSVCQRITAFVDCLAIWMGCAIYSETW